MTERQPIDAARDLQPSEESGPLPAKSRRDEALLTPSEAAQYLKVSAEQIRSLIRRGLLPAVNISAGTMRALYRIKREALDDFLSDRSSGVKPSRTRRFKPRPPVRDFFAQLP